MSSTYCVHAWNSLNIDASGEARICCMSSQRLGENGRSFNLAQDSIEAIWASRARKEIVAALSEGEQHKNCELCWREEAAGRASKRVRDNHRLRLEPLDKQPRILDLKLGHLCNLKCRTCGSHSSSKWVREEFDLNYAKKGEPYAEYQKRFQTFSLAFAPDNPNWEILDRWGREVRFIDFFGGEPMLIQRHWAFLEANARSGASKEQVVHYNTNGTIFPEAKLELFSSFRGLDLSLSMDGVARQFEYIRHPAKWDEVLTNYRRWKDFLASLTIPFKNLSVCCTVSLYNIFDLDVILERFADLGFYPFLNLVHWPSELSIAHLPQPLKLMIAAKLESRLGNRFQESGVAGVVNFMLQGEGKRSEWDGFLRHVARHDAYRVESFDEVFPEYAAAMRSVGNE